MHRNPWAASSRAALIAADRLGLIGCRPAAGRHTAGVPTTVPPRGLMGYRGAAGPGSTRRFASPLLCRHRAAAAGDWVDAAFGAAHESGRGMVCCVSRPNTRRRARTGVGR